MIKKRESIADSLNLFIYIQELGITAHLCYHFQNILLTALTIITNLTASITKTQVLQFVLAILCTTIGRLLRTLTQIVSEPGFTLEDKIKIKVRQK